MPRSGTLSIPLNPRFNPSERACEFISLLALARDLQLTALSDAGCENSIPFAKFKEPEPALRCAVLQ